MSRVLCGTPAWDSIVFAWECVGSAGDAFVTCCGDVAARVSAVGREEEVCCVLAGLDPVSGRELNPRVLFEGKDELLAISPDDTTGVVPLSFKKLVQLGTLVAFGSGSAKS